MRYSPGPRALFGLAVARAPEPIVELIGVDPGAGTQIGRRGVVEDRLPRTAFGIGIVRHETPTRAKTRSEGCRDHERDPDDRRRGDRPSQVPGAGSVRATGSVCGPILRSRSWSEADCCAAGRDRSSVRLESALAEGSVTISSSGRSSCSSNCARRPIVRGGVAARIGSRADRHLRHAPTEGSVAEGGRLAGREDDSRRAEGDPDDRDHPQQLLVGNLPVRMPRELGAVGRLHSRQRDRARRPAVLVLDPARVTDQRERLLDRVPQTQENAEADIRDPSRERAGGRLERQS